MADRMTAMAGKSAPPLFDLIRHDKAAAPQTPHAPSGRPNGVGAPPRSNGAPPPAAPPAPAPEATPAPEADEPPEPAVAQTIPWRPEAAPAPEPKPQWAPKPRPEPEADDDDPSPLPSGPRIDPKKTFSIPVSVLYVVVPLTLAALLVVWSIGYSRGERSRDDQLSPYLEPGGAVVDPLLAGQEEPAGGSGSSVPVVQRPPARDSAPAPAPQRRTAGSPVTQDSRVADNNYLLIARLDGERAIKAAMALTERGAPAIAVDPSGGRSKNGWRLYSLLGIPSEKFKEQWQARADHKSRIESLCGKLGADAGGPIDASTAYWEKYTP